MKRFAWLLVMTVLFGVMSLSAQETMEGGLEEVTADSAAYWGKTVTLEGTLVEYLNSTIFVLGEGAALDDDRVLVINDTGRPLPANFIRGSRISITGAVLPSFDARANDVNAAPFIDNVMNDPNRFPMMSGGTMMGTDMTGTSVQPGEAGQTSPMLVGTAIAPVMTTDPMLATIDPMMMATVDPMMATVDPMMMATVDPMMMATVDPMMATPAMMMPMNPMDMGYEDSLAFYYGGALPEEFYLYTIVRLSDFSGSMLLPQG